ncbi:hypothetical protein H8A95_27185 [Bradyrhizobium sp. Pear76]|nr:hypothetical protein [Bradyrhizobium oropedii]MCC8965904.1 hypothetical protein [Bradyrhizobium oropedii]
MSDLLAMAGRAGAKPGSGPDRIRRVAQSVVFAVLLHANRVFTWGIHLA